MTITLEDLLGIELPLIQAPMAGVQGSALAIAVCNAGGLGSLPCAMLTPDALRSELAAIADATPRPFNVNFFCHSPPIPDPQREAAWRASLAGYFREFGIDATTIPAGAGRNPFTAETADVIGAFRPPVVSFHFGLPSPELVARVKGWGARVLSSATTVAEARWLEAHGADIIIAQGYEAGGHRGMFLTDDLATQIGTLALVRQLVREVRVPVVAAGGIADSGGARPRRGGRTGGHRVSPLSRSDDEQSSSRRAQERRQCNDCSYQSLHRPAGARHRQPFHARAGTDERHHTRISARDRRDRAVAGKGGECEERRFLTAVVRSESGRLPGDLGRGADARPVPSVRPRSDLKKFPNRPPSFDPLRKPDRFDLAARPPSSVRQPMRGTFEPASGPSCDSSHRAGSETLALVTGRSTPCRRFSPHIPARCRR